MGTSWNVDTELNVQNIRKFFTKGLYNQPYSYIFSTSTYIQTLQNNGNTKNKHNKKQHNQLKNNILNIPPLQEKTIFQAAWSILV